MPDYDFKYQLPVGEIVGAYQKRAIYEQEQHQLQNQREIQGMAGLIQGIKGYREQKKQMAQQLAGDQALAKNPEFIQFATGKAKEDTPVANIGGMPVTLGQTAQGGAGMAPVPTDIASSDVGSLKPDLVRGLIGKENPIDILNKMDERKQKYGNVTDTILQKDALGNIVGQTQSTRPRGGKTLFAGPSSTGDPNRGLPRFLDGMSDVNGTPLVYDPKTQTVQPVHIAPSVVGGKAYQKGTAEAITQTNQSISVLRDVDELFNGYSALRNSGSFGETKARLQTTGLGNVLDPRLKALQRNIERTGFIVGGKQLTGTELEVVKGAFFPTPFDNEASLKVKQEAIHSLLSGQIDLANAARLLGPAGAKAALAVDKVKSEQVKQNHPKVGSTFNGKKVVDVQEIK